MGSIEPTSRERVRRAMASGTDPACPLPDRVPVLCQLAVGHYFLHAGLAPFDVWFDSGSFAEALVRLAERYRFDGILVNLPGRDPALARHIRRVEREEGRDVVFWDDGGRSVVPRDDNVHYFRPDGTRPRARFEDVEPGRLYYVEPWDVAGIRHPFIWGFEEGPRPPEDFFPPYHLDALRAAISRAGGRLSVHAEVFSPFSQLCELAGCEEALAALLEDPGKVQACLERLAEGAADLAARQAACGPDAILVSSAYAGGGFISRDHYRSFVLPHEKKLIGEIRRRFPGLPVYTHTCGKIGDRLDLLLETGTCGIDTLDPPPLGTVDLAEAKRALRGRAFIKGNMDPVNTLLRGTPEDVRADARSRIGIAKPGGGYILSSACSVAPATPPENLAVLAEVAEECGRY